MKRTVCLIAVMLAYGFSTGSFAQGKLEFSGKCVYPKKPEIVNGNTATEAEMLESRKQVQEYQALGNAFLECIDAEAKQITSSTPKEQANEFRARINEAHNAVVDEMNSVADLFNAALRAFKGRNQ